MTATPCSARVATAARRVRPQRVGERDPADELRAFGNADDRLTFALRIGGRAGVEQRDPRPGEERRRAQPDRLQPILAGDAAAGVDAHGGDRQRCQLQRLRARDDRAGERVRCALLQRQREEQQFVNRETKLGIGRHDGRHARGQRPGLVDDERVDLLCTFERRGVADEDARRAPLPTPTISAVGVARPSAHGHAITSTAVARISASPQSPSASPLPTSVIAATTSTAGTNQAAHGVGHALHRRLRSLRGGDLADDAGEQRRLSDGRRLAAQRSLFVDRPGEHADRRAAFATGWLSPVSIDSLTADSPLSTRPSTGTLAPARTTKTSPARTCESGTSFTSPSRSRSTVGGRSASRCADRVGGPRLRPTLEQLAEQHERDHHGRRFEVHVLARRAERATRRR